MYLKLISSVSLFTLSTALGFIKSEKLKERVKLLGELKRTAVFLQGELRFHRSILSDALENVAQRVTDPLALFLKEVAEKLEQKEKSSIETIWNTEIEKMYKNELLLKEDIPIFSMLGNSFGYLDVAMQLEHLNLVIIQTEDAIKSAKEQQEIKGKLYRTMGATIGAFLVLLVI